MKHIRPLSRFAEGSEVRKGADQRTKMYTPGYKESNNTSMAQFDSSVEFGKSTIYQKGFSIVELMIATFIGLIVSIAIMQVYLAQSQIYKTSTSQGLTQSAENAIYNLVTPIIRSAGFTGCGTIATALSSLNPGGSPPLGTLSTTPSMIMGYSGGAGNITITQLNSNNDNSASSWSPALDSTLVGQVQKGNDVLVVLGGNPWTTPIAITTIEIGSSSFDIQSTPSTLVTGQYGAVSDCLKTTVFQITGISGTTISHNAGSGSLQNASSTFTVNYQNGSQFLPLQQTAFFVGKGQGGQSALMKATLSGGIWTVQPLVSGINIMKVQFGIGAGGNITQYVPASSVTSWGQVYSVRIGFLIEGQPGSSTSGITQYTVLDSQVTVPSDTRLRHVYEITVNLRNALS